MRDVFAIANMLLIGASFSTAAAAFNEPPFCASFAAGLALRIAIYEVCPPWLAAGLTARRLPLVTPPPPTAAAATRAPLPPPQVCPPWLGEGLRRLMRSQNLEYVGLDQVARPRLTSALALAPTSTPHPHPHPHPSHSPPPPPPPSPLPRPPSPLPSLSASRSPRVRSGGSVAAAAGRCARRSVAGALGGCRARRR